MAPAYRTVRDLPPQRLLSHKDIVGYKVLTSRRDILSICGFRKRKILDEV